MTFLPKNYEIPEKPSNYMKFKKGMNRFRILSPAITGWEYWTKENKPVRSPDPFDFIPEDIKTDNGMPTDIKHFWAFIVWNYAEERIQILELTQKTIQEGIKTGVALRNGNATNNDIGVNREGEGFDTVYSVQFADPTPVSPEIEAAFKVQKINLKALYTGEDPFAGNDPTPRGEDPYLGAKPDDKEAQRLAEDIPF